MKEKEAIAKFHFDNYYTNPKPCGDILLYQLGELYCSERTRVGEHKQFCYEFTYVLSGRGSVYINGQKREVKAYDCIWCKPDDMHRIDSDLNAPLRYCYFAYASSSPDIIVMHDKVFEQKDDYVWFNDKTLEKLFLDMLGDIDNDAPFSHAYLCHLIHLFVIRAYRQATHSRQEAYDAEKSNIQLLVYQISRYIDENVLSLRSLTELENVFHFNYQYLSKSFYKIMNRTIQDYYLNRRMEKALEMMLEQKLSASKTAELLGYSCPQAFYLAFKSRFKSSPKRYINAYFKDKPI